MAFPFQGSNEPFFPHPPITTSNFFSVQAIKFGYSGMEALQRELEERIKEEIMASRIARRRMVEEEVRREHELMIMGKRFHEPLVERLGPNVVRRNEYEERCGPNVFRRNEFGERFGPNDGRRNVEVEEMFPFGGGSSREVERRVSPVPMRSDVKMINEVNSPNQKLSDIKRKTSDTFSGINNIRFPQPLHKDWSCALCQVSATCEDNLNVHLQGKKHRAMVAQLSSESKPTVVTNCKSSSSTTKVAAQKNKDKNRAGKGKGKFSMEVKGKVYEVVERAGSFWCSLCTIQCTSKGNMAKHLVGKKHVLEELRTSKKPVEEVEEVKMINEVNSPNQKLSEIKRKTSDTFPGINNTRFPQPLHKDWSRALCQVSATCEDDLNAHLKGKKHHAIVTQLSSESKPTVVTNCKSSSSATNVATQKNKDKNRAGKGKCKFSMEVKGKVYEVVEWAGSFWCCLCTIQCTSKGDMAEHLVGRKHVLEELRTSKKPVEEVEEVKMINEVIS